MFWFRTGTISLTLNSTDVIAVGASFVGEVKPGEILLVNGVLVEIERVVNATTIRLVKVWPNANLTNVPYAIIRNIVGASNFDLMKSIENFLTDRQRTMDELVDWMNGQYNAGPNTNGTFPMTDRYGITVYAKSPPRLQYESDQLVASLNTSLTSANTALTALGNQTTWANQILGYKDAAAASATLASQWADNAENVIVTTGKYSAKHHAIKAAASQADVTTRQADVVTRQTDVTTKQTDVTTKQTDVTSKQADVVTRQANVVTLEASALASKNSATTSAATATTKASEASTSAAAAVVSKDTAEKWSSEADNVTVTAGKYSAKHHANKAATSASAADTSKTASEAAKVLSETAKTASETAKTASETAKTLAQTAKTGAETARTGAETAKTAAESARDEAVTAAASVAGGLVDLGQINMSSNAFPTKPTTYSSFWKVTTPGVVSGVDYGIGDTLIYSKTMDQFYKIDNTESVSSVNGSTGAITITPASLGALPVAGVAASATKLATARAITLSGDLTGTANFDGTVAINIAAEVTDDSHTHYQTALSLFPERTLSVTAANWVTIATSPSGRAFGEFMVYDSDSSRHNIVKIIASEAYGKGSISCVGGYRFGTRTIAHARIIYNSADAYGGAKLQIYCENATWTLRVRALGTNQFGSYNTWDNVNPVAEGTPAGWVEMTTARVDDITNPLNPISGNVKGNVTGNADTATKLAATKTINGVAFDGSGNILIESAPKMALAGPLSTELVAGVGGQRTIRSPGGGVFSGPAVSTGTLKITLPKSWTNTMMAMRISIYDFGAPYGACTINLGGYNATAGSGGWSNASATSTGAHRLGTSVRFGHDGTNCCILIATTTTALAYIKVVVEEVQVAYQGVDIGWDSGWTITQITSEAGITVSSTEYFAPNNRSDVLNWQKYINHLVFDASNAVLPSGVACDTTDPINDWIPGYPTLMGTDGATSATFGVRVARSKKAEQLVTARTINGVAFDGTANIVVADSAAVAKTGATITGNLIIEADDYGVGWARGFSVRDGGVTKAAIGAYGGAGTFINAYMGVGTSPWAAGTSAAMRMTATGTELDSSLTGNGGRWINVANSIASPTYNNSQLEVRSSDGTPALMSFHRGGYTACALVHISNGLELHTTAYGTYGNFRAADITAEGATYSKGANWLYDKTSPVSSAYRSAGMYGVYDSLKIGHIWSMGTQYAIPDDGTTFGGIYGMAYKHTNNATGGTMAGGHQIVFAAAGAAGAAIGLAGNIWTSGNVSAYSDIRVKTNIQLIPNALEKVCQLRGVTYERTDRDGERQTGLIAQEVKAVLPEAVSGEDMLSVAYGNMVGLLVESIKELKGQVDDLKAEVAALKGGV